MRYNKAMTTLIKNALVIPMTEREKTLEADILIRDGIIAGVGNEYTEADEIIEACSRIYQVKGFNEVTIKAIAELTSFSRPSIYNYFETKEEIFLDLLTRECERWADKLEALPQEAGPWDRVRFTDALA